MIRRRKKWRAGYLSETYLKGDINPDDILLDTENLPSFDVERLEGSIEKPIQKGIVYFFGVLSLLILLIYSVKAWNLQIVEGERLAEASENNRLRHTTIIAERGIITDRNEKFLAWNIPNEAGYFSLRKYIESPGFAHVLGYISYPQSDTSGVYFQPHYEGKDGIEQAQDGKLAGTNGLKITETDARNITISESVLEPPTHGTMVTLSIDADLQQKLFESIKNVANEVNFQGGAGAIMDIESGELYALVSFPEFSSQILTDGKDAKQIGAYANDPLTPYINRAVAGVYTPGSIVKPFIAIGALNENIIDPDTKILSTGSISIPNPYDKTKSTVFRDWRAHGYVDMRKAIAVSSDVYFYEVGGGFENQKGLGISNIEKYLRLFGFGAETGIDFSGEEIGTIPNPDWKYETFDGDEWRVGDTYNTAIGQYGMQMTLIQALRGSAALARNGVLVEPTILKVEKRSERETSERIPIPLNYFEIVQEGMREAVISGTAAALNLSGIKIAAKTGTAELGVSKKLVNSWVIGYFPYEKPRFAFAVLMEKGPRDNLVGASAVSRRFFEWLVENKPEYTQ